MVDYLSRCQMVDKMADHSKTKQNGRFFAQIMNGSILEWLGL